MLGVRDQAEFKNKRRLENFDMWFIFNLQKEKMDISICTFRQALH
jgi:hypothetical protein